jgi:hypothetical protein
VPTRIVAAIAYSPGRREVLGRREHELNGAEKVHALQRHSAHHRKALIALRIL